MQVSVGREAELRMSDVSVQATWEACEGLANVEVVSKQRREGDIDQSDTCGGS